MSRNIYTFYYKIFRWILTDILPYRLLYYKSPHRWPLWGPVFLLLAACLSPLLTEITILLLGCCFKHLCPKLASCMLSFLPISNAYSTTYTTAITILSLSFCPCAWGVAPKNLPQLIEQCCASCRNSKVMHWRKGKQREGTRRQGEVRKSGRSKAGGKNKPST